MSEDPNENNTIPMPAGERGVSVVAGRYRLLEPIGRGGFGQVYRAHDTLLDRDVALKMIRGTGDALLSQRFLREARATARFHHPNVVALHDAGEDSSGMFLILELVDGESLAAVLSRGPLPIERAAAIVRQIATALQAGHEAGIIHRDLKPSNVLLTKRGEIKLADFGLAHLVGESRLTQSQSMVGTPLYMSPEQIEGHDPAPPSDIFALGAMLQELLTGIPPFRAGTPREILARISAGHPEPLPPWIRNQARAVADLIARMLEKDPSKRPSACEVTETLTTPASATQKKRARPAVGAVVFIALLIALWVARPVNRSSTRPVAAQQIAFKNPAARDRVMRRYSAGSFAGLPVAITAKGPSTLEVRGSDRDVKNAVAMAGIVDALHKSDFFRDRNLFTGDRASTRLIDCNVESYPATQLVGGIASAVGWPLVMDPSIDSSASVTLDVRRAPWDTVVNLVLDQLDAVPRPEQRLWTFATAQRWAEEDRAVPAVWVSVKPRITDVAALARLLEPARSKNGVVAVNRRTNSIIIADHAHTFADYAKVISAAEPGQARDFGKIAGRGTRNFTGSPISLSVVNADIRDVIKPFSALTGLNIVVDPDVAATVTADFIEIPWDQALDAIIRSRNLTFVVQSNTMRVLRAPKLQIPFAIETVRLKREDPEFFRAFDRTLSPEGTLAVDRRSRTLVVRDRAHFARTFRQMAEEVDRLP